MEIAAFAPGPEPLPSAVRPQLLATSRTPQLQRAEIYPDQAQTFLVFWIACSRFTSEFLALARKAHTAVQQFYSEAKRARYLLEISETEQSLGRDVIHYVSITNRVWRTSRCAIANYFFPSSGGSSFKAAEFMQ